MLNRQEKERKEREEEYKKMMEKITDAVREALKDNRMEDRRSSVRCFYCNRIGHVARKCYVRREKEQNFNKDGSRYYSSSSYFMGDSISDSGSENEKGYRRVGDGRRRKVMIKPKEHEPMGEAKRKKLNLGELVKEFKEVFEIGSSEIKYCKLEKCRIETEPGKKIVKRGQAVAQALIKKTVLHLEDLERRKVIRPSTSEWRNPVRAVEKPNGDIRLVSNLIALNDIVAKDEYRLASIRDVVRATQGAAFMTVFDLKEGFYSIEIQEEDKYKTAFEFNGKVYEWNSMVMGYKNSPQILQRTMDRIFRDLIGKGVQIYMDDIVIYGKSEEEHERLVREVCRRLKNNNMRLNPAKVQFAKKEVKLLGVTLNGKDIVPSEIKKNEALEFPVPAGVSDVRRFLGLTGWFRDFIKDYARLTVNLTNSLKGKGENWAWSAEMENEFLEMKRVLREMGKLQIADYDKEFLLRTDASNLGMGAVLLQKNGKDEWVPVQWASKKFTPTEVKYGISEKEMYAVFWAVKKFEYELRGRKFRIETDHKALIEIRNKPDFKNNRINRWIEKIQEFDFTIEYRKPELMVVADALSRVYTKEEEEKKKMIEERRDKQIEGKFNKHSKEVDGKKIWTFDSGEEREVPPEEEREKLINDCHLDLAHRGKTTVYYALRKKYYWLGMKDQIEREIKKCEVCQKYNRKTSGGNEFICTSRYLEKVGMDLIEFRDEGVYVVVAIDYFTRRLWGRIIKSKSADEIVQFFKDLCTRGMKPEGIVTDNAKEFQNDQMRELCSLMDIEHRKIGIESHKSNGRVERIIRTVRESILKSNKKTFEEKVGEAIEKYNNSFHVGINCTPIEATNDTTGMVMMENSPMGNYAGRFKKWYREKFERNQVVRVSKRENLLGCSKYVKGRFLEVGRIIEICPGDSYIVKLNNRRLVKKRHYDLKGMGECKSFEGETNRLGGGC